MKSVRLKKMVNVRIENENSFFQTKSKYNTVESIWEVLNDLQLVLGSGIVLIEKLQMVHADDHEYLVKLETESMDQEGLNRDSPDLV